VTGELDVRSQDQLLLDAVLATNETLVLVSTAANTGAGQERPPWFLGGIGIGTRGRVRVGLR